MADVEQVTIESDERGFELHLDILDYGPEADFEGHVVLNIHAVALELYDQVIAQIGPWRAEMLAAKREYDTGVADDPTQQPVLDRIKTKKEDR